MHQSFPLLIWNERSFHAQRNTKISGVTKEHQPEIVSCSLFSTGPHTSDVWGGAGWVWPEEIQHIRWGTQETAPCCEMLQKGTVSFWWRWMNVLWLNNFFFHDVLEWKVKSKGNLWIMWMMSIPLQDCAWLINSVDVSDTYCLRTVWNIERYFNFRLRVNKDVQ